MLDGRAIIGDALAARLEFRNDRRAYALIELRASTSKLTLQCSDLVLNAHVAILESGVCEGRACHPRRRPAP